MIDTDYRNTPYCPILDNVTNKKNLLEKNIRMAHPKQKIMYNKVRERGGVFNKEFCSIYNCKCAYCGVSMDVLSNMLFEVDHFVAESLFDNKEEAGKVENLVLACYQCNRNKNAFSISGEYRDALNTDDGKITNVFYRDDQYYIQIHDDYIYDEKICEFYNKLQLQNQSRRLDYLLMSMQGLHKKIGGTKEGGKLAEAIIILQRKRNRFVEKEKLEDI